MELPDSPRSPGGGAAGEAAFRNGDLLGALAYFSAALDATASVSSAAGSTRASAIPRSRRAALLTNQGLCLYHLEKTAEAADKFSQAVQLAFFSKISIFNRGIAHRDMKLWTEALNDFRKVQFLDAFFLPAVYGEAWVLLAKEKYPEAIEVGFSKSCHNRSAPHKLISSISLFSFSRFVNVRTSSKCLSVKVKIIDSVPRK